MADGDMGIRGSQIQDLSVQQPGAVSGNSIGGHSTQSSAETINPKVDSLARASFSEIKEMPKTSDKPIRNPSVLSAIGSSVSANIAKLVNVVMEFLFPPSIDKTFVNDSLKDFKGTVKTGSYYMPKQKESAMDGPGFREEAEGGLTKVQVGAGMNAQEMLKSTTIRGLVTVEDAIMPGQFVKDMERLPLNICGISNRDNHGIVKTTQNNPSGKAEIYNGVSDAFAKEGIGAAGLIAACELIQQGSIGDLFGYLSCYNNADDGYAIDSANLDKIAIKGSFEGAGDGRVFRIEITTKNYDVHTVQEKNERGNEVNVNKQEGCITITRTIDVPVKELKQIELTPKSLGMHVDNSVSFEENANIGYTISNIPKNITGKDEWSAYKPISNTAISNEDQIAKGRNSQINFS